MDGLLRLVPTLAIVSAALSLRSLPMVLRNTALVAAGSWGAAAVGAWIVVWMATEALPAVSGGVADQLWLAVAVLTLSPFVSALGARRPGCHVWSAFVVVPVTAVLLLPAATAWNADLTATPLELETPMLAGYILVLLMGTGNYVGTRFTVPALLVLIACLAIVVPMSDLGRQAGLSERRMPLRALAAILMSIAIWRAARLAARRAPENRLTPFDTVWTDFHDYFGIVWATRVVNRFNEAATSGRWNVRLHLSGFARADGDARGDVPLSEFAQIEHTLGWLLRRFVDAEWLAARRSRPPR